MHEPVDAAPGGVEPRLDLFGVAGVVVEAAGREERGGLGGLGVLEG